MRTLKSFNIAVIGVMAIAVAAIIFLPGHNAFADTTTVISTDPNVGVAAAVQSYFADIPIMIAIAKCESGPRQFEPNGTPLLGGTGTMVGVFQLDETIHTAPALALGFDITTLAGNMSYARYLYGVEGTEPWISSFGCWSSALASTTTSTTTTATPPALTMNLSLGAIEPQVLVLQQMLNAAGFTLATSGPGSPGNETIKFGALTYVALKKFQCAQGIACSGEEATTGYGFLNAVTRAALLSAASSSANSTIAITTPSTTATTTTIATTTTATPVATSTAPVVSGDSPAEITELESRVSALVAIVAQLEAEIAARSIK